jgi:hypothetical protein
LVVREERAFSAALAVDAGAIARAQHEPQRIKEEVARAARRHTRCARHGTSLNQARFTMIYLADKTGKRLPQSDRGKYDA